MNGDPQERVQYFVVGCESERGKDRGLFTIDKYTGQVITENEIDREIEGSTIILHIIALIGQDKMSGTKVKISLQDENDSEPVFDLNFDLVLSEAYLPGHKIGFAKATDADLNSILTYSSLILLISVLISSISDRWDYRVKMFCIYLWFFLSGIPGNFDIHSQFIW